MRIGILLLASLMLTGCSIFPTSPKPPPVPPRPSSNEVPTAADLVGYLNRNARSLQSLQSQWLELDCSAQGQSISLNSQMWCQKPRNFRLVSKVAGFTEADFGSNAQEFWFWVKKNNPPHLFYCSYADLSDTRKQVQLPFPFQPVWVVEALGMAEYPSADGFKLEVKQNTYELSEKTVSPQGQPVLKVISFSRWQVQPPTPQVIEHALYDAQGRLLCKATTLETSYDKASNVIYPSKIKLEWPAEKVTIKMSLGQVTVNPQFDTKRATDLFTRPSWPSVKNYDLASGFQDTPTAARRVGTAR